MLKIWGRTNSVNVKKVLWAAEELGLQYQRIDAGLQYGVNKTPEYLKMNPTGLVPTMDDEGYVRVTGRLKEIINRGGEKISPREVDDVLMDHPAVRQVVTFAVPHDKLGEDVAAAVVLREGAAATEKELREFLGQRLAAFKVPRTILFLDEIPKGATGKLQRIGLAQKLGLA